MAKAYLAMQLTGWLKACGSAILNIVPRNLWRMATGFNIPNQWPSGVIGLGAGYGEKLGLANLNHQYQ